MLPTILTNTQISESIKSQSNNERSDYLQGLNIVSLAMTNGCGLSIGHLRLLCKGLIPTSSEGKQLSRVNLCEKIKTFIDEARAAKQSLSQQFIADYVIDTKLIDDIFEGLKNSEVTDTALSDFVFKKMSLQRVEGGSRTQGIQLLLKAVRADVRGLEMALQVSALSQAIYKTEGYQRAVAIQKDKSQQHKTDRREDRTTVNKTAVMDFATKALTDLTDWKDVVFAISVFTGRRCAEILGADTLWELEKGQLYFTGILKGKGWRGFYDGKKLVQKTDGELLKDIRFPVLCLCEPSLVMAGLSYLEGEGKLTISTDRVNVIYSSALSQGTKTQRAAFEGMTFGKPKDMRTFYMSYLATDVWTSDTHNSDQFLFCQHTIGQVTSGATEHYLVYKLV